MVPTLQTSDEKNGEKNITLLFVYHNCTGLCLSVNFLV